VRKLYVIDPDQFLANKKDKTIKLIMLVLEKHIKKNTKEFAEIRNTILDGINDLYKDMCLIIDNIEVEEIEENGNRG
jgi:hypothetical protein